MDEKVAAAGVGGSIQDSPGLRMANPLEQIKQSKERTEKKLAMINDVLAECEKNPSAVDLAVKILAVANQY